MCCFHNLYNRRACSRVAQRLKVGVIYRKRDSLMLKLISKFRRRQTTRQPREQLHGADWSLRRHGKRLSCQKHASQNRDKNERSHNSRSFEQISGFGSEPIAGLSSPGNYEGNGKAYWNSQTWPARSAAGLLPTEAVLPI